LLSESFLGLLDPEGTTDKEGHGMPVPTKHEGKRFQFYPTDETEAVHKSSTVLNRRRSIINPPLIPLGTYPVNSTETSIVGPVRNPVYPGTAAYDALYENVS
jgi:hypothetical protein